MKKLLSLLLCAALLFTMAAPVFAADGDTVIANLSAASEFMNYKFQRAQLEEVKGYAGKDASDSSLKITLNTNGGDYNAYVDFKWGTATKDSWDKLEYKGYLVNEFSVINNGAKDIYMCTDQNGTVSGRLLESAVALKDGEWNKVVVITDRTGGEHSGKSITYINGKIANDWHQDAFGTKHSSTGVYKNALRYLCEGDDGTGMYIDDLKIYETQTMPDVSGEIEIPDRIDIANAVPQKIEKGSRDTVAAVFGKPSGDSSVKITATGGDCYYGTAWTPKSLWSKYLVYEVNVAPDEKVEKITFATNGNAAMSPNITMGKQLTANRWNKLVMVYNISTGKSDIYINGAEFYRNYAAGYIELNGAALRLVIWGDASHTACVDDMQIYECAEYPQIAEQVLLNDGFDKTNGVFVTNETGTLIVKKDETAAEMKALFGDGTQVRIYPDEKFESPLADGDEVSPGAIAAVCGTDETYSYYKISNFELNNIIVSGNSYDGESTVGKENTVFSAMSDEPTVLVAAQYDEKGNLIKTALSPSAANEMNSVEFEPNRVKNSYIKAFLLTDMSSLKPLCAPKKLDYYAPMDVLVIGNSFSMDVTWFMRDIAAADGKDINVCVLNKGGSAVAYHYDNRETSLREIMLWKNNATVGYTNLKNTLKNYDWDIVVLQNWGNSKAFYTNDDSNYETNWSKMADLAEYVHENKPKAKIMIHETWSFESCYSYVTDEAARDEITEGIHELYARCARECAERIGEDEPLEMISSLDAFEAARHYKNESGIEIFNTTYYKDGHVFTGVENRATVSVGNGSVMLSPEEAAAGKISLHRDGFHASAAARYLIALNAYTTITGRTVIGNSFRPGEIALDSSASYTNEQIDLDNAKNGVIFEKYDALSEGIVNIMQEISDGIAR